MVTTLLAILMFVLPFFLAPQASDNEKLSSYECGFEPFEDARLKFDIHFYIIAILFIIFYIEILFYCQIKVFLCIHRTAKMMM